MKRFASITSPISEQVARSRKTGAVVNASIEDIIKSDVPALLTFFRKIKKGVDPTAMQPIDLFATKIIIGYALDR